jgi:hypothetical protein
MPDEQFAAFHALVLRTPALQAQLRAAEEPHAFVALVVRLGAECGYRFGEGEVRAALAAARRAWAERWVV